MSWSRPGPAATSQMRRRGPSFSTRITINADAGDEAQAKQVTEFFLQLDTLYERSNDFARAILKDEWERVKTGEEIYKFTRQILGRFIVGFAICLLALIVISFLWASKRDEGNCPKVRTSPRPEATSSITNNFQCGGSVTLPSHISQTPQSSSSRSTSSATEFATGKSN